MQPFLPLGPRNGIVDGTRLLRYSAKCSAGPVNTTHLYSICTMLDQRRRRLADVVLILYKCFVLTGRRQWKPFCMATRSKQCYKSPPFLHCIKLQTLQVKAIEFHRIGEITRGKLLVILSARLTCDVFRGFVECVILNIGLQSHFV